ncbi:MAG: ATP-binding protein [Planctomycetes bacterium]|nr:ATP-binding protein [Planctomycetota bacterium]MBU1518482.1 ATP-binding protein [Planctomycetota bacterium]MBU2457413.1 ATP-binding protein [Planctomycetota bacterium]MBU2597257.1 ATP-binding protein [Planctomycetota bacterium]
MTLKTTIHEKIVLKGIISELRAVCAKVLSWGKNLGYSDDDLFAVHLAMEEAIVNAVKHGNKQDTSKTVSVEYDVSPEKIDISVADEGRGFDSNHLADPRLSENIYKMGGRGVLLIKSYMDEVEYNTAGNTVRMIKFNSRHGRDGEPR